MVGDLMTNLSRDVLEKEISENKLVGGVESLDKQLTANGIDVRLAAIIEVVEGGTLAVEKARCKPPVLGQAWVMSGFENVLEGLDTKDPAILGEGSVVGLKKNVPYLVVSCETVDVPEKYMFKIETRSSVFRLIQGVLETAFGEAGYRGKLTFLLFTLLDAKIELGSRFAQIAFSTLEGCAHYENQKESSYQDGKIL